MTKKSSWKFHVDEFTTGRYNIILGRDLLTALGLDLKFYENILIGGKSPYEGLSAPMFDVINCGFNFLTDKIVKVE